MSIRIADLPEDDRPRERLWRKGVAALSNAELIALVLRQGRAGESALDLAARLLVEHGGLDRVALTDGSIDRSLLPVREVLNAVLRNDGAAFALAHNHPSGDLTPSPQDLRSTEAVALAAPIVGLRFLDHLIVTDSAWINLTPRQRE